MRKRIAKASLVLLIVSVVGLFASMLYPIEFDGFDAYGEVPIPGTRTLHLPAGDVTVGFHSLYPEGADIDKPIPIPQDLEVTITPPRGVAEPKVTKILGEASGDRNSDTGDGRSPVRVAHIPQAGDYTITTNGKVTPFVNPRLAFGHPSRFWFLPWLFGGLCVVSLGAFLPAMPWWSISSSASGRTASAAEPPDISAAELRESGQRVRGVLKSFTPTGETVRSRGVKASRPEFLDYPYYALVVELQFPNLAPVIGRNRQPIPLTEVPNLAIGRELNCAADPADPTNRFIVDWS